MGTKVIRNIEKLIGTNLKVRRLAAGLSQGALGKKTGITFQQIQKYEKGVNRLSISRGLQIAAILKCEFSDFLPAKDGKATVAIDIDRLDFKVASNFHKIDAKLRPQLSALIDSLAGAE